MGHVHLKTALMAPLILAALFLSHVTADPFTDKSETSNSVLEQDDKRRVDRYGLFNQLGKREEYPGESGIDIRNRGIDHMMFHGALGKRDDGAALPDEIAGLGDDFQGLDKKGRMDTYGLAGMLGKRRMDRYSFTGALGKRPSSTPFNVNIRGLDRYSFAGALGKRGYGGDDDDDFTDMDKRSKLDRMSFFGALGKRGYRRPMQFFGQLGKRRMDLKGFIGQLGKRAKRSVGDSWSALSRQRYPARWVRGIDRYSFLSRLGKRTPNYGFYPTLGKREDDMFDDIGTDYGYDSDL